MCRPLVQGLLLVLLSTLVAALAADRSISVYAWPPSSQQPQLLADIQYNSTHADVRSSRSVKIQADDKVVRVGFYHSDSTTWSGIVTAAENFGAEKEKTILLNLDSEAVVYHVGFRAVDGPRPQKGARQDSSKKELRAEVMPLHATPKVHVNKPIVLDATGQPEQPPEKTFLQKYWWAIAAFLVIQVFLSGGSDKKE